MAQYDYDMLVIGSGPAGERAAIQAAKLNKKVAIVERADVPGGTAINTGTIPSKTLREAVMHLTGYREHNLYGESYAVKQNIDMPDLLFRADTVIRHEIDVMRHQLTRNRVELIIAEATFVDPHTLSLDLVDGRGAMNVSAEFIVIATGTTTTAAVAASEKIDFNRGPIFLSDDILNLDHVPRTLTVVGAGVIGMEYASIFAALGSRVTVIDKRDTILPFFDKEIVDALLYHLRNYRVGFMMGEEVSGFDPMESDGDARRARIHLRSGKQIVSERALYSIGRLGATRTLNLDAAGVESTQRGLLEVNEHFQTSVPHVYAAGDVIGFPSLASTSMEQGRLASCHAFQIDHNTVPELFPFGIYTIPEISMVGKTEDQLTEDGTPYAVGKAYYRENARGQIIGDESGMLKLLFSLDDHKLLGVHAIGEGASEIVHIGQAVLALDGNIEYFVDVVFNYPTLASCYKTAALDGLNRLAG